MSYPTGQVAPGSPGRVRPGVVSVSSYLLYAVAAIQVISFILVLLVLGDMRQMYEDLYAEVDGGETVAGVTTTFTVVVAGIALLLAAGLVVLAIFNNRGKNVSRIITWVVGGLGACCCGLNLIGTALGAANFGTGTTDPNMPTGQEIQDKLSEALPGWYNGLTTVLTVVTLIALLAALVLLALPPANEFFTKPQSEWQPPMAGQSGYVAYPAYPTPGQPMPPTVPPMGQPPMPPSAGQSPTDTPPGTIPPSVPPVTGQPPAEPNRTDDFPRGDS